MSGLCARCGGQHVTGPGDITALALASIGRQLKDAGIDPSGPICSCDCCEVARYIQQDPPPLAPLAEVPEAWRVGVIRGCHYNLV